MLHPTPNTQHPTPNRKRLALSLAGITAAAMLTFVACKKEPTEPLIGEQPVRENLENRIVAFVERANSQARNGGTMITADSAEWYVEAALNYSNADLTIVYNDAEVDKPMPSQPTMR